MARKKKHEEHENLERWLVSYADFITLLFAFFTVMYALSMTDKKNYQDAIENIQRAFQSSGGVFPLKGSPLVPFDKAPDKGSKTPPSPVEQGKFSRDEDARLAKISEQMRSLFEMTTGLKPGESDLEVLKSDTGYKIRLGEAMVFKAGSDRLRRETLPFLYELGKRLSGTGFPIQVEGHSDNRERGETKATRSPWALSVARSTIMAQFLVEGVGFSKKSVSITGYGDAEPLADNDTAEGRARNRRVEISIQTPDREVGVLNW